MDEDLMPEPLETADGEAMSDSELVAHLDEHEKRSVGYFESEIASDQASALDRYYRRPYGDEREGRSSVVDATVAITIDNALAALLKPFVSSDDTVMFEPRSAEDEEQARQATEYVNFVLNSDNPGFLILHDWFKDALLQKLGVVKLYWEAEKRAKPERLNNLDPVQLQQIMGEEQVIGGPFGPDEYGLFTLDILKEYEDGCLKIENVPPEEYRISPYARPGRVPPYEAHVTNKSRSELVEMGFDPEVVEALSKSTDALQDTRAQARYSDEEWASGQLEQPGDRSRELVAFNHEFALIDVDGDGVSELREIMRSGDVVLYNEEVECGPFARLCPVPMPHKVYGLSLADQVSDEQRIATVLWRQTLDNLYLANNPRIELPEAAERSDGSTIDDLLDDSIGAAIRTAQGGLLNAVAVPFVADKSFPMLDYVANQAESRTGIMKQGQGMDPDAIDRAGQVTATQAAIMEDGRNSRVEMIARIFAETGIKDLFRKMLRLLVTHQPRERIIRLRNKWVEMDPRAWNADMDVSISVGLGMGNKAQQLMQADAILATMAELGQTPFASLIDKDKVYNAVKRKFTAAGIKNIDDFLIEPERDEQGNTVPEQEQPDPETMKAQAELQMQQAKLQAEQQMQQAKLEMAREEAGLKAQLAREEAAAKLQLEREKAQAEATMNQQRLEMELQLAERKAAMQERLSERDAQRRDSEADAKLKSNRPGGSLSE